MIRPMTSINATISAATDDAPRRGRPPGFRIDGAVLAELRGARALDHAKLHELAFPKTVIAEDSRRRSASRWEAEGRVKNRATAVRLAEVVGTTVAVLEGGAPEPAPDRVREIAEQLARQLEAGNPKVHGEMEGSSGERRSIEDVSRALALRIELAQLTRQTSSLRELSEVTGWSAGELERPTNLHGYWLVAMEGAVGTSRTEVLVGIDAALWRMQTEVMDWLRPNSDERHPTVCGDARLVFKEEAPWFRVQLVNPERPWASKTLSLVRCEPCVGGMKRTTPGRYDRQEIHRFPWLFWSLTNFIDGFGAAPAATDVRRLRLLIERPRFKLMRQAYEEGRADPLPEIVAVVDGDLGDLEDERLEAFRREGSAHFTVVNRLAHGLWAEIAEDMKQWPRDCWKVSPGEGVFIIELDTKPRAAYLLGRRPRCEPRFRISVVELMDNGEVRNRPWRSDSVAQTIEVLERHYMRELPDALGEDQELVGPRSPADWPDLDDD